MRSLEHVISKENNIEVKKTVQTTFTLQIRVSIFSTYVRLVCSRFESIARKQNLMNLFTGGQLFESFVVDWTWLTEFFANIYDEGGCMESMDQSEMWINWGFGFVVLCQSINVCKRTN